MLCFRCDEPIDGRINWITALSREGCYAAAQHEECAMRSVIGGLNHQLGCCTCCGGTEPPDPPWLSKRSAAVAAVAYYRARRPPAGA